MHSYSLYIESHHWARSTPFVPPWFHLIFFPLSTPFMLVHFLLLTICFLTFSHCIWHSCHNISTNVGVQIVQQVFQNVAMSLETFIIRKCSIWVYVSLNTSVLHNYLKLLSCKNQMNYKKRLWIFYPRSMQCFRNPCNLAK